MYQFFPGDDRIAAISALEEFDADLNISEIEECGSFILPLDVGQVRIVVVGNVGGTKPFLFRVINAPADIEADIADEFSFEWELITTEYREFSTE